MLYVIVSFDETEETDFVPVKWIADDIDICKIQKVVENRGSLNFYWPPWRNPVSVSKAKKDCSEAEVGWPTYSGRILSTASNIDLLHHTL